MAKTRVDHVNLTVTTVDVFIQTMKFIHENDLWDDTKAHLKSKNINEMFVDFDVFFHFRELLKTRTVCSKDDPLCAIILGHPHHALTCDEESSK
jgi:hypothetical protein